MPLEMSVPIRFCLTSKDKDGFYVYAKPNLCDTDSVVKYICCYLGRPVIATSHIDSYDGENITFHYNRHEDNSYVLETLPVLDFIQLLIQHIPEKHFKMTRHYGLCARHREIDSSFHNKAIPKSRQRILLDPNIWRTLILLSFSYDPLQCPKCNHQMVFLDLYHKHERVPLEELRKGNGTIPAIFYYKKEAITDFQIWSKYCSCFG